jgi:hypothetical protein
MNSRTETGCKFQGKFLTVPISHIEYPCQTNIGIEFQASWNLLRSCCDYFQPKRCSFFSNIDIVIILIP